MECPIGLICEHFECRRELCESYAAPIALPYRIWEYEWDYPKGTLVCQLPDYEPEDYDLPEFLSNAIVDRNAYIRRIRRSMQEFGWHGCCDLPYEYDSDNRALVVFCNHLLGGESYELDAGRPETGYTSDERGFVVAVPLNHVATPKPGDYGWSLCGDGFVSWGWIMWKEDFDKYEEF